MRSSFRDKFSPRLVLTRPSYTVKQVFGGTTPPATLRAGTARQLALAPFEVRVLELLPARLGH